MEFQQLVRDHVGNTRGSLSSSDQSLGVSCLQLKVL